MIVLTVATLAACLFVAFAATALSWALGSALARSQS